jgi:tripartite-type tricarboxylate transporter receptor subunit TctC
VNFPPLLNAAISGRMTREATLVRLVRVCVGRSLLCAISIIVPATSAQEKWPSHRVTIVVPFAAGSNTDACARLLAELLRDIHGQSFIVENRGGAGGTVGANAVAKSSPDGYTLLMAGNTMAIAPATLSERRSRSARASK